MPPRHRTNKSNQLAASLVDSLRKPCHLDATPGKRLGFSGWLTRIGPLQVTGLAILLGVIAAAVYLPANSALLKKLLPARTFDWQQVRSDQLPETVARLTALDTQSLPALVAGLDSPRAEVCDACEQALQTLLKDWERRSPSEQAQRMADLAALVADQAASATPNGIRRCADLIVMLLQRSSSLDGVPPTGFTDDCEQVITQARAAQVLEQNDDDLPAIVTNTAAGSTVVTHRQEPQPESAAGGSNGSLGRIRVGISDEESTLPSRSPALWRPRSEMTVASEHGTGPHDTAAGLRPSSQEETSVSPRSISGNMLYSLADNELMRWLGQETTRQEAANELRRRGYTDRDIGIAVRAVDPDPERRLQLAQLLPQLSGVDPRPWLMYLSHDESPQVRGAAVRWLATSPDPQIRGWLQDLAREETDESVRAMLR